ncbi:hypothetical protein HU200_028797 [Digitaria exilis]|uniref:Uncharacterized protein n=1 Tax=Digitaria exilis TaxID=1010633 RepID=A0A835EVU1_9POAL|nr:hypothetical protein HU200_028797 [Digitaria exilis]
MARPHAVVVPYPGSGNINPALQLSKLLRRHGVFITFVVTEHNLRRVQAAEGAMAGGCEGFRIEAIPDGMLDADRDGQDYDIGLSKATTKLFAAPLRDLVARLRGGDGGGVPPVTCVLPTSLMSFALDVARELGVPLGDVSSFVRTTDANDFGLWFNITEANNCTKAGAIIINTFDALEADVLTALRAEYPRIFTVGQLGTMLRRRDLSNVDKESGSDSIDLTLWKHDTECLA